MCEMAAVMSSFSWETGLQSTSDRPSILCLKRGEDVRIWRIFTTAWFVGGDVGHLAHFFFVYSKLIFVNS
jgi:hypothetical protein